MRKTYSILAAFASVTILFSLAALAQEYTGMGSPLPFPLAWRYLFDQEIPIAFDHWINLLGGAIVLICTLRAKRKVKEMKESIDSQPKPSSSE